MSVSRKSSKKQAVSSACPPPGTTEASAPLLPVPCTVILHLLGPDDPDPLAADPAALTPDNDDGPAEDAFPDPQTCPTCGTPRPPFHVRLSGLLDLALQTREAASTLVHALEQEVLP